MRSLALRYEGRRRVHNADEYMAAIAAERVVRHLERAGLVVMKRRPEIGGAALGGDSKGNPQRPSFQARSTQSGARWSRSRRPRRKSGRASAPTLDMLETFHKVRARLATKSARLPAFQGARCGAASGPLILLWRRAPNALTATAPLLSRQTPVPPTRLSAAPRQDEQEEHL
jgi:hypothetical protein